MDPNLPPIHLYVLGIGTMAVIGLLLNALALVNLAGLKSRMVTVDQQKLSDSELRADVTTQITAAATRTEAAIDKLRGDYAQANENMVSIKASHDSLIRQTEHMTRDYSKIQIALLDRILEMAGYRRPSPGETAAALAGEHPPTV